MVGLDPESDVDAEEDEVDDEEEPGEDGEHVDVHLGPVHFSLSSETMSGFPLSKATEGHSLTLFTLEQTKGLQVEMEPFLTLRWRTEN